MAIVDPEPTPSAARPERTIVFNGKFLSAGLTGVHRVAEEMVRAVGQILEQRGGSAEVLCPRNLRRELGGAAIRHRRIGALTWVAWEQLELPIHAHGQALINLCNLGPLMSRHAVTMIHDAQVYLTPDSYSRPFRLWYRLCLPVLGHRHRHILTVSNYSRDQLVRFGIAPRERITVVHNGADHVLRLSPDPSILRHLTLSPLGYCCALANTQRHKNIATLLHAFANPRLSHLRLVLIGTAGARSFQRLGHPTPRNVTFAGHVTDGELRSLLENALAFLCPSTTEGFGLPPLESMILGTPAIVAPRGALPEICGAAAIYASATDPEAWTERVLALSADPALRATYSRRGRAHAATFTWRRAALELLDAVGAPRAAA